MPRLYLAMPSAFRSPLAWVASIATRWVAIQSSVYQRRSRKYQSRLVICQAYSGQPVEAASRTAPIRLARSRSNQANAAARSHTRGSAGALSSSGRTNGAGRVVICPFAW